MKKKENNQFVCPYANTQPCSPCDDEINLLDIWDILWKRRLLIVLVTALVTATATAYSFLSPKTYETIANISTPLNFSSDPGTNILLSNISKISTVTVFNDAVKNIQDKVIQAQFASNNKNEIRLLNNIKVKLPNKKRGEHLVSVSMAGGNPETITELLNNYISYVDGYGGRTVVDSLKLSLAEKKSAILAKIEIKRRMEMEKIKQRIAQLNEQKAIAERLNLVTIPEGGLVDEPLYARGTKVLQAEIDSLMQRKNIDSFIEDLPALQEQLRSIEIVDLSKVKISTMQASLASIPNQPKKPKQQLIVVLGLVLGLMLGVFAAFVMNFVGNMRQRSENGENML